MTIGISNPVRGRFDQLKVRSHRMLWTDYRRGVLDAVTSQPHDLVQATAGSGLDVHGTAFTGSVGRPVWSVVGGRTGLLRTPATGLYYRISSRIVECSGIVEVIDQGALDDVGTVLARISLGEPGWTLAVGANRTVVATLANAASADSVATSGENVAALGEVLRIYWGIEFVGDNWRAILRTKVDDGAWSSLVEGTERDRDATSWDLEDGEDFARYYVSQAA